MRSKALRTLSAFDVLARAGDSFVESAASRMYYAVFQAAVAALERQGRRPDSLTSDAVYWGHDAVRNNASLVRGRREDRAFLRDLFQLRVRADYSDESLVLGVEVARLLAEARAFVEDALA